MAISGINNTTAVADTTTYENPDGILSKDDFMMLLLVELQNQDPTEPTDTATILTQTSQLATLEASDNTNKALEDLALSLAGSNQFSNVAVIGKTADMGSNAISYNNGSTSTFEVYFPGGIDNGSVEILDADGAVLKNIDIVEELGLDENFDIENIEEGVYQFTWDGTDSSGTVMDSGFYYVTASYDNLNGEAQNSRLGTYPIESVKFEEGNTLIKIGSSYIPLADVSEIY